MSTIKRHSTHVLGLLLALSLLFNVFFTVGYLRARNQLTLADPAGYDKVLADDRVAVTGLAGLAPGKEVTVTLTHADGSTDDLACRHTLTNEQIEWFQAGSALAWIGRQTA